MKNFIPTLVAGLLLACTTGCTGNFWCHHWPWETGGLDCCHHDCCMASCSDGNGACTCTGEECQCPRCGCTQCDKCGHCCACGCLCGHCCHGNPADSYNSPFPGGPGADGGGAVNYPYYTTRGPRDFFAKNPPSIGP